MAISGPIPPYSNPPIEPQFYAPSRFVISAIVIGVYTTITTTTNHNYVIGQQIRLIIPNGYGAPQLNQQTGNVIAIPALDQVVVTILSIGTDPFRPTSYNPTPPQIVAIGDENNGLVSSTGRINTNTAIPGSFINISPN